MLHADVSRNIQTLIFVRYLRISRPNFVSHIKQASTLCKAFLFTKKLSIATRYIPFFNNILISVSITSPKRHFSAHLGASENETLPHIPANFSLQRINILCHSLLPFMLSPAISDQFKGFILTV